MRQTSIVLLLVLAGISNYFCSAPVPLRWSSILVEPEKYVPYNRKHWGSWKDLDHNCRNTRSEILIRDSLERPGFRTRRECRVMIGLWHCPYTGRVFRHAGGLDIDHIVPLAEAARSGGHRWNRKRKIIFANDPLNLLAVSRRANRRKRDKDPARWMPKKNRCDYIRKWVRVKKKYRLTADRTEARVIRQSGCIKSL